MPRGRILKVISIKGPNSYEKYTSKTSKATPHQLYRWVSTLVFHGERSKRRGRGGMANATEAEVGVTKGLDVLHGILGSPIVFCF